MASDGFSFLTRTQFQFTTSSCNFSSALDAIAADGISLLTYNIRESKGQATVLLVAGLPDSTANDQEWNKQVARILDDHCIYYGQKEVVQVLGRPAGTPGVISAIYGALNGKVYIYNIYMAEATTRIIDSSNNAKVIAILSGL